MWIFHFAKDVLFCFGVSVKTLDVLLELMIKLPTTRSCCTELAKKVCPCRLRDSACWRSGEITQPRTNFFGQLCTLGRRLLDSLGRSHVFKLLQLFGSEVAWKLGTARWGLWIWESYTDITMDTIKRLLKLYILSFGRNISCSSHSQDVVFPLTNFRIH